MEHSRRITDADAVDSNEQTALAADYEIAFREWESSDDSSLWELVTRDGIPGR